MTANQQPPNRQSGRRPNDLAEQVRQEAMEDALHDTPVRRLRQSLDRATKSLRNTCLKPIREKIDMARKAKMRTIQQYLCDQCDCVIPLPNEDGSEIEGLVVHGNIYAANPATRGGLVGNNFPDEVGEEGMKPEDVRETVLCLTCFLKAIGLLPMEASGDMPLLFKKFLGETKEVPEGQEQREAQELNETWRALAQSSTAFGRRHGYAGRRRRGNNQQSTENDLYT